MLVDGKLHPSGTWLARTDLAAVAGLELLTPPADSISCCAPTDTTTGGCC